MSLVGHSALITGASRGLGSAIARTLAQNGCSVALLARNRDLLEANLKALPLTHPSQNHSIIDYDLARLAKGDVDPRIEAVLQDCTVLVNNAGVTNHKLLARLDTEEIVNTVQTNLIAPMLLTKMATRPMMRTAARLAKSGLARPVVVNIASVLSFTKKTASGTAVYAGSKAGLLGFTTAFAAELRGKARVNAVLPALIPETDMGKNASVSAETVGVEDVARGVLGIVEDDGVNGRCFVYGEGVRELTPEETKFEQ